MVGILLIFTRNPPSLFLLNELWRNIVTDCSSNYYRFIVYTQITDSFSLFVSISYFFLQLTTISPTTDKKYMSSVNKCNSFFLNKKRKNIVNLFVYKYMHSLNFFKTGHVG